MPPKKRKHLTSIKNYLLKKKKKVPTSETKADSHQVTEELLEIFLPFESTEPSTNESSAASQKALSYFSRYFQFLSCFKLKYCTFSYYQTYKRILS